MSNDQAQNTDLIAKDISYIQKDLATITQSIKELAGVYQTKSSFEDFNKALEIRLQRLEEASTWRQYIVPVATGLVCTVMTFLVLFYLQNLNK